MEGTIYKLFCYGSLIIISIVLLLGLDTDSVFFAIPIILIQNFYMIMASKKNYMLLLITIIIAYSNYSVLFANFINPIDSGYVEQITQRVTNVSVNVLLLFNCTLISAVRWNKINDTSLVEFSFKGNILPFYSYFLLVILFVVFFFGFTLPDEVGGRGSPKAIYEYAIVFFILLFFFYKNKKFVRVSGTILVLLYSLQNFIFGGRILGIQFILCVFLMLYINKIPKKIVLLLLGLSFFLMTFIGIVRGELLTANFDIVDIFNKVIDSGFASDTAYSAYYCAESFVYCHDIIPFSTRMFLFGEFLKGVFISTNPEYVLHSITAEYVHHTGGGFIPHFFYFYLGPLGIFVGGLIVSLFLNAIRKVNNASSGLMKCVTIFVTCLTFRWYLYTPLDLMRGSLFLMIVYFLFTSFVFKLNKKYHKLA